MAGIALHACEEGTSPPQVSIEGPAETVVRRGPLEHGAYSFGYSTKTPGTYTISATAAGGHMEGSPATVTASIAEAYAPLCEVVGTPLRISTIAGEPDLHAQSRRCSRSQHPPQQPESSLACHRKRSP